MKYMVITTPRPLPPPPEPFDAAMEWIEDKLEDGTFDCVYGYLTGGGSASSTPTPTTTRSEIMVDYPMLETVDWEIGPLLEFGGRSRGRSAASWSRPKRRWPASGPG